jgi:recombination protein RecA
MARRKSLADDGVDVVAMIDAQYKNVRVEINDTKKVEVIPTGSMLLDQRLGVGGIPRNRLTQIEGWEGAGKTTLGNSIIAQEQILGGKAAVFDFEQKYDQEYARNCGVDTSDDKFLFYQPQYLEQGQAIMEKLMKSREVTLIIVDSIAAMQPAAIVIGDEDKGEDEKGTVTENKNKRIGLQAQGIAEWAGQISKWANLYGVTVVCMNQVRVSINTGYGGGPDKKAAGGRALPFYLTVRIELQSIGKDSKEVYDDFTGEKEKVPHSQTVKFRIQKNQVGNPFREGKIYIRFGEGVDNFRTLIDIAKNKEFLNASKNGWCEYGEVGDPLYVKTRSEDEFRQNLKDNPALLGALMAQCGIT